MQALDQRKLNDDWTLTRLLEQVLLTTAHVDAEDTHETVIWDDDTERYNTMFRSNTGRKRAARGTTPQSKIDPITGVSLRKDSWYSRGHGAGRTGKPFNSCPKAPAGHEWLEGVWQNGWAAGRAKGMLEGKVFNN
jgi:hypothetical protein